MTKGEETYFVCTSGDSPLKMFFNKLTALNAEYDYVDSFDAKGNLVECYKRMNTDTEKSTYTTDF